MLERAYARSDPLVYVLINETEQDFSLFLALRASPTTELLFRGLNSLPLPNPYGQRKKDRLTTSVLLAENQLCAVLSPELYLSIV